MHISSTVNPLTKSSSDVPVLVLALSNADSVIKSRKFVARPTNYVDLVSTARRAFKLAPGTKPNFFTKTLDVCRGHLVEIDESAYMMISSYLDEVTITVTTEPGEGGTPAPVPDGGSTTEAREDASARPLTAKRLGKTRQIDVPEGSADGARAKEHAAPSATEGNDVQAVDDVESEPRDEAPGPAPRETAPSRSKPKSEAKPSKREEPAPPAQMPPPPVPKTRISKREPEAHELFDEEPSFSEEAGYEDYEEARNEGAKEGAAVGIAGGSRESDDSWNFEPGVRPAKPASAGSSARSQARDLPETKPEPEVRVQVKAKAKTEAQPGPSSGIDGARLPSASSRPSLSGAASRKKAQEDERFTVTVIGPHDGQAAEFKTRGKHSIKKVLASVCKTFEVDPERARLLLVVEDGDEEIEYYCDPEETMEMCGVVPDSRLVLEVRSNDVDDEGEEDE